MLRGYLNGSAPHNHPLANGVDTREAFSHGGAERVSSRPGEQERTFANVRVPVFIVPPAEAG